MEQKRRQFNWFDAALVLLVAAAAFVWLFVWNRPATVEDETFSGSQVMYLIEVNNLTAEQIAKVEIGAALQEGSRHLPIGRVATMGYSPFLVRVDDHETQTITWEPVPNRYSMTIVVQTYVVETPDAILAEGTHPIRGGASISFTGPGFGFSGGVILGLLRGEA